MHFSVLFTSPKLVGLLKAGILSLAYLIVSPVPSVVSHVIDAQYILVK